MLLQKPKALGIKGTSLKCTSFLTGKYSLLTIVKNWARRGSILGSLLYLVVLHVADMPDSLNIGDVGNTGQRHSRS